MRTNMKIFIIILASTVLLLIFTCSIDEHIGTFTRLGLLSMGVRICCGLIGGAVGFRLAKDLRKEKDAEIRSLLHDLRQDHNPEILEFIAGRLVNVYGENPNTDFVITLRREAEAVKKAFARIDKWKEE